MMGKVGTEDGNKDLRASPQVVGTEVTLWQIWNGI